MPAHILAKLWQEMPIFTMIIIFWVNWSRRNFVTDTQNKQIKAIRIHYIKPKQIMLKGIKVEKEEHTVHLRQLRKAHYCTSLLESWLQLQAQDHVILVPTVTHMPTTKTIITKVCHSHNCSIKGKPTKTKDWKQLLTYDYKSKKSLKPISISISPFQ